MEKAAGPPGGCVCAPNPACPCLEWWESRVGRGGGDPCRSEELGLLQRCGAREKEQIRPLPVVSPPPPRDP